MKGYVLKIAIKEKLRTGNQFRKLTNELCEHDSYSLNKLRSLQQEKLKKILNYAYKNCEYYNESFLKAGIRPDDIKTIDDLRRLPILNKCDVLKNFEKICSNKKSKFLHKESTSGTTGTPLYVVRDLYSINYENAAIRRIYKWAGYEKGDKIAFIRGYKCNISYYDRLNRTLYINANELTNRLRETYYLIEQHKVKFIYCVSSTAEILSTYIINSQKPPIKLKGVITSSETLTPLVRDKVKMAFQCEVYDYYGATERVAMIANCSMGEYHLMLDYGAEHLKSIGGNYYEIISTNLFNYAMPLINYATGDIIEIEEGDSKCGMKYPVIKSIIGRESDFINLNNLRVYSTELTNIFNEINDINIIQSQFIQEKNGGVTLNLIQGDKYNLKAAKIIKENFKTYFNYNDINITINDDLIINKSGKVQFIVKK